MKLEDIAKTYGMNDYYDMHTGYTYHLSQAYETVNGKLKVPVSCIYNQNGANQIMGYATMEKVK